MRWPYRSASPSDSGLQGAESGPSPAPRGEEPCRPPGSFLTFAPSRSTRDFHQMLSPGFPSTLIKGYSFG